MPDSVYCVSSRSNLSEKFMMCYHPVPDVNAVCILFGFKLDDKAGTDFKGWLCWDDILVSPLMSRLSRFQVYAF